MKIITNPSELSNCALALGNFDGVHIAHSKIISSCVSYARNNKLKSGVLLFENHTSSLLENINMKLLTPLSEKLRLLEQLGVDFVFLKTFDNATMYMTPEKFFDYIKNELRANALFTGYNYRFGHKASGDSTLLSSLCNKNNMFCSVCEQIDIDNNPVSSTHIRKLIVAGNVADAQIYLNRYYSVDGKIVKGKQNGTKMGIPTANIEYNNDKLLPCDGVYIGYTTVEGLKYKSLINIGKNPTFNAQQRTVESHIPYFNKDIYGYHALFEFVRKIRDDMKFKNIDELIEQINKDIERIADLT